MFNVKDIALRGTISAMVEVYKTEIQRIRDAYTALETASQNLTLSLGKESSYSSIDTLPRGVYSYSSTCEEVLVNIRQGAWKRLISQLGIRKVLSISRSNDLDRKLEDKKELPELTVENIYSMFELLLENANDFAKEAVLEVYEKLHHRESSYKTNQRNAFEDLGKKIIMPWMVEHGYSHEHPFRVSYNRDSVLMALDKVFHNLDGAPFMDAGYQSPLIDAINTSPDGDGETAYFKFKCYGNRNLHLEFTRADLLKKFNQVANDGTRLKSGITF